MLDQNRLTEKNYIDFLKLKKSNQLQKISVSKKLLASKENILLTSISIKNKSKLEDEIYNLKSTIPLFEEAYAVNTIFLSKDIDKKVDSYLKSKPSMKKVAIDFLIDNDRSRVEFLNKVISKRRSVFDIVKLREIEENIKESSIVKITDFFVPSNEKELNIFISTQTTSDLHNIWKKKSNVSPLEKSWLKENIRNIISTKLYDNKEFNGDSLSISDKEENINISNIMNMIDKNLDPKECIVEDNYIDTYEMILKNKWSAFMSKMTKAKINQTLKKSLYNSNIETSDYANIIIQIKAKSKKPLIFLKDNEIKNIIQDLRKSPDNFKILSKIPDSSFMWLYNNFKNTLLHDFKNSQWKNIWNDSKRKLVFRTKESNQDKCLISTFGTSINHDYTNNVMFSIDENGNELQIPDGLVDITNPTQVSNKYLTDNTSKLLNYTKMINNRINFLSDIGSSSEILSETIYKKINAFSSRLILDKYQSAQAKKGSNISTSNKNNFYIENNIDPKHKDAPFVILPQSSVLVKRFEFKTGKFYENSEKNQKDRLGSPILFKTKGYSDKEINSISGVDNIQNFLDITKDINFTEITTSEWLRLYPLDKEVIQKIEILEGSDTKLPHREYLNFSKPTLNFDTSFNNIPLVYKKIVKENTSSLKSELDNQSSKKISDQIVPLIEEFNKFIDDNKSEFCDLKSNTNAYYRSFDKKKVHHLNFGITLCSPKESQRIKIETAPLFSPWLASKILKTSNRVHLNQKIYDITTKESIIKEIKNPKKNILSHFELVTKSNGNKRTTNISDWKKIINADNTPLVTRISTGDSYFMNLLSLPKENDVFNSSILTKPKDYERNIRIMKTRLRPNIESLQDVSILLDDNVKEDLLYSSKPFHKDTFIACASQQFALHTSLKIKDKSGNMVDNPDFIPIKSHINGIETFPVQLRFLIGNKGGKKATNMSIDFISKGDLYDNTKQVGKMFNYQRSSKLNEYNQFLKDVLHLEDTIIDYCKPK